jgi:monovalent cation:H+ antiporter, CPA1 family
MSVLDVAGASVAITALLAGKCVGLPLAILTIGVTASNLVQVLTWGGLRGGILEALALSLQEGNERAIVITLTYVVVVFSLPVQGLSIGKVVRRLVPCSG